MKLLLCGGGSGEKTIETNKVFDKIIDHKRPLLYIPLAMPEEEHTLPDCYEWIKKELSSIDIPNIKMVTTYEELNDLDFNNYCAIFIGGGNTFSLLKGLKDTKAFEKLKDYINNDGIVYGGSAGAIIFGYDINSILAMDPNDVELKDTKGFNVLNGKSIFCHYTNEYTEQGHIEFTKFMEEYTSQKETIIAIPEEDTIYIDGDNITIIGNRPYYEFNNGIRTKYEIETNKILKK